MIEEVFYSCNENYDKLQWNMKTCNQKIKSLLIIDQPTIHLGSFYYSLSTPRDTMGDSINSSHTRYPIIDPPEFCFQYFPHSSIRNVAYAAMFSYYFIHGKRLHLQTGTKFQCHITAIEIKLSSMRESCSGEIRSRLSPGSKLDSISVQNRLVFHQPLKLP